MGIDVRVRIDQDDRFQLVEEPLGELAGHAARMTK
jgi:hypothetical protein